MPRRFLLGVHEQSPTYSEAVTILRERAKQDRIEDIDFELGPPNNGRLPCRVIIGCRKTVLCELSDIYPPFDDIRSWMERALRMDRIGRHHEQVLTLDCPDAVYTFRLKHAGWEELWEGGHKSIHSLSIIIALDTSGDKSTLFSLCRTHMLIGRLYCAIMECFVIYRERFNNDRDWLVMNDSPLDRKMTSELLYDGFRSQMIETLTHFRPRKKC